MTTRVERPPTISPGLGAGHESAPFPNPHPAVNAYAKQMSQKQASEQEEREKRKRKRFSIEANVLGIPEDDLTPPVEAALTDLAGQVDALTRRLQDLADHQADLERELLRDEWTGLANRKAMLTALGNELPLLAASGEAHCLIFMEIDGLAGINLAHGHYAGDLTIKQVAHRLTAMVALPDLIGFLGNNEFVILMHRIDEDLAAQRARDITRRLATEPFVLSDRISVTVHLSFGVHRVQPGESAEQSVAEADRMLRLWKMNRLHRISTQPDQF